VVAPTGAGTRVFIPFRGIPPHRKPLEGAPPRCPTHAPHGLDELSPNPPKWFPPVENTFSGPLNSTKEKPYFWENKTSASGKYAPLKLDPPPTSLGQDPLWGTKRTLEGVKMPSYPKDWDRMLRPIRKFTQKESLIS